MWRCFLSYCKTNEILNMSNLQEKAEKFAQGLWGDCFDATPEHIEKGVIFGYELCQKEYEEKLRWIPVEEKLPEIGQRVLLKNEFYEYVGFLSKNEKDFRALTVEISHSNEKINGITHWRFL